MYQLDTVIEKWQQIKDRKRKMINLWTRRKTASHKLSKMSQEELKEFDKKQRRQALKELIEFTKYVRDLREHPMISGRMLQRAIKFKKWECRFEDSFEGMAGDKTWILTKEEETRIENLGK